MKIIRNFIRQYIIRFRTLYLVRIWGHKLHPTTIISFSAYLDRTSPDLIEIGEYSIVTRGAMILSHDYSQSKSARLCIGKNCLIGANAIVLPGVSIGDEVVVGAGSVVTKNIESNSIAVGNPAAIIKKIRTGPYGRIISQDNKK